MSSSPRRRLNGKLRQQKGKDGKRARAFHRGRAQGEINDRFLRDKLEPAYARAEADVAEVAELAVVHRRELRDYESLIAGLARVSCECALAPLPLALLG